MLLLVSSGFRGCRRKGKGVRLNLRKGQWTGWSKRTSKSSVGHFNGVADDLVGWWLVKREEVWN
jgi:hypothetical protein